MRLADYQPGSGRRCVRCGRDFLGEFARYKGDGHCPSCGADVERRRNRERFHRGTPDERLARVQRAREAGETYAAIAKREGLSTSRIQQLCEQAVRVSRMSAID